MADLYCPWGGDISFASNGDFRMTSTKELAEQRIARRLLTNPAQRNALGEIVLRGDDLTNQDYGKGLGRGVDGLLTAENQAFYAAKVRAALLEEPEVVDVKVKPTITFESFPTLGLQIMTVEFQTITGEAASVNASL
jgi:hypothetical protein